MSHNSLGDWPDTYGSRILPVSPHVYPVARQILDAVLGMPPRTVTEPGTLLQVPQKQAELMTRIVDILEQGMKPAPALPPTTPPGTATDPIAPRLLAFSAVWWTAWFEAWSSSL